jgi:small subunit ribosomal protein S17
VAGKGVLDVSEPASGQKRGSPRKLSGQVVSHNRSKTIKVVVASMTRHATYGKYRKHRTVCHVHDEQNEARTGDVVEIQECRPVSKTKHWRLVRVLEKNRAGEVTPAGAED